MNIFATIEQAITFSKVTYYTVKFENEKYSEFEKFILKHQSNESIHNEYQDLLSLIERLGKEIGAKPRYFRPERNAQAFPPNWNELTKQERKLHVTYQHNLRLYCMRINDEIVFLFNGGIKTSGHISAQQCKNVRQFFNMANQLAEGIENAIKNREIIPSEMTLGVDNDFELMI